MISHICAYIQLTISNFIEYFFLLPYFGIPLSLNKSQPWPHYHFPGQHLKLPVYYETWLELLKYIRYEGYWLLRFYGSCRVILRHTHLSISKTLMPAIKGNYSSLYLPVHSKVHFTFWFTCKFQSHHCYCEGKNVIAKTMLSKLVNLISIKTLNWSKQV